MINAILLNNFKKIKRIKMPQLLKLYFTPNFRNCGNKKLKNYFYFKCPLFIPYTNNFRDFQFLPKSPLLYFNFPFLNMTLGHLLHKLVNFKSKSFS